VSAGNWEDAEDKDGELGAYLLKLSMTISEKVCGALR